MGFYIPEDDILRSHCCENLKSYSEDKSYLQEVILCRRNSIVFSDVSGVITLGPPLWYSGQTSWLQTQRSRVRFVGAARFSE
jgi:hypothetical protein